MKRAAASRRAPTVAEVLAPRWRGQPGRLEVWYATLGDPESGTGCWIHHELVAPVRGEPYVHGWAAVFRRESAPVLERFGRAVVGPGTNGSGHGHGSWPSTTQAVVDPPTLRGTAGRLAWDLRWEETDGTAPLCTFPRWAWDGEVLPAAQVVPVPSATFTGTVQVDGTSQQLSPRTTGGVAHVYGQGNAQRWGWLHADLGGGDVLEVVAAVSRRPGLDRLPPLALVQLRTEGRDWPRDPLLAAPLWRTRLGLPRWQVRGTVGGWRLRVDVELPESDSVSLRYEDPDGASATCTNCEVANAEIVLEHRRSRWETMAAWILSGRAHAEIGTRP